MGQVRHGSATTTHAVRKVVQRSQASLAQLSKEFGINPKTVAQWRKCQTVEDLKTRPNEPRSSTAVPSRQQQYPPGGRLCRLQSVPRDARRRQQPVPGSACWAHLRRDFHDVWEATQSEIAREALDRIGKLYDLERQIAGQPTELRKTARQQHSRPKVDAFRAWAELQLARIPGKGDLAKAFRYGLSRWTSFELYL